MADIIGSGSDRPPRRPMRLPTPRGPALPALVALVAVAGATTLQLTRATAARPAPTLAPSAVSTSTPTPAPSESGVAALIGELAGRPYRGILLQRRQTGLVLLDLATGRATPVALPDEQVGGVAIPWLIGDNFIHGGRIYVHAASSRDEVAPRPATPVFVVTPDGSAREIARGHAVVPRHGDGLWVVNEGERSSTVHGVGPDGRRTRTWVLDQGAQPARGVRGGILMYVHEPDSRYYVWDPATGRRQRDLPPGSVVAVSASHLAQHVVIGRAVTLHLVDVASGNVRRLTTIDPAALGQALFDPTGRWLAVATDAALLIFDVARGRGTAVAGVDLRAAAGLVLSWSPDGERLHVGAVSRDGFAQHGVVRVDESPEVQLLDDPGLTADLFVVVA